LTLRKFGRDKVSKIINNIKKYWQFWIAAIAALLIGKKVSEKKSKKEIKNLLAKSREAIEAERKVSAKKSEDLDNATTEYMESIDKIIGEHEKKVARIQAKKKKKSSQVISADQATNQIKDRLK